MRIFAFAAAAPDRLIFESTQLDFDASTSQAIDVILMLPGRSRPFRVYVFGKCGKIVDF
jgi:hypothetical protein